MVEPVAIINTLLIEENCLLMNCFQRVIANQSLCQQLKIYGRHHDLVDPSGMASKVRLQRPKAVFLLWFLSIICYAYMYNVFSNMAN